MTLKKEELLEAYRRMRTIREFEENIHRENTTGEIPGFLHLYCGQEANAVAVCMQLEDTDYIASANAACHLRNALPRVTMCDYRCAGRFDHCLVATGMVAVFVGVDDLGDGPVICGGDIKTLAKVERVDGKCLAGLGTGDQVVEIPV